MDPIRWQAVCRTCGRTIWHRDRDTERYAVTGWPVCCGADMTIRYRPDGGPPGDPPNADPGAPPGPAVSPGGRPGR